MSIVISDYPEPRLPRSPDRRATEAFFGNATRWLVVLIGFSIPVSTSLSEIATTLFIVCWLLAGDGRAVPADRAKPVARLSLAMFAVLFAATTWSSATWYEAGRCLLKYREFVYLPLLVPVFLQDPRLKVLGLQGFTAGALAILGLSYFEWLSGTDFGLVSYRNDYVIGKDRIIHSILMALLVYVSAQDLMRSSGRRWLHALVIALAVPNILFLVQGRTGYLLLGLLTILFMAQHFGRRGLIIACLLVGTMAWGAYAASETFRARVAQTVSQLKNQFGYPWQHSWDPRLEYYEHTLTLIRRHPFLGTGTGSFSREYARVAKAAGHETTTDPHNEYLHLAVQAGLPTAALFVALLVLQWHWAGRLPPWESRIGRGIALAIAVGSLFNSLILSITGGLVWSYFGAIAFAGLSAQTASASETESSPAASQKRAA